MTSLSKYEGACGGKAKYDSRKDAARAASRLRKRILRSTGFKEPIGFYHCEPCHKWHVGHTPGWRREMGIPRPVIRTSM